MGSSGCVRSRGARGSMSRMEVLQVEMCVGEINDCVLGLTTLSVQGKWWLFGIESAGEGRWEKYDGLYGGGWVWLSRC